MNHAELVARRRQTIAVIRVEPTIVYPSRPTSTKNGRGGQSATPTELPPWFGRLMRQKPATFELRQTATGLGAAPQGSEFFLMRHGADAKPRDTFVLAGQLRHVTEVISTGYETRAYLGASDGAASG